MCYNTRVDTGDRSRSTNTNKYLIKKIHGIKCQEENYRIIGEYVQDLT